MDHDEYVSIPGEALKERDGEYEIRVTEELREVSYLDQITLQAVDHPADERNLHQRKVQVAAVSGVPSVRRGPAHLPGARAR